MKGHHGLFKNRDTEYPSQIISPYQEFYGTGAVTSKGDFHGRVNSTGGATIEGDLSGVIDTTGLVIIKGSVKNGARIKNTGGVIVKGNFEGGVIDTTGDVVIYGNILGGNILTGGDVLKTEKETPRETPQEKIIKVIDETTKVENIRNSLTPEKLDTFTSQLKSNTKFTWATQAIEKDENFWVFLYVSHQIGKPIVSSITVTLLGIVRGIIPHIEITEEKTPADISNGKGGSIQIGDGKVLHPDYKAQIHGVKQKNNREIQKNPLPHPQKTGITWEQKLAQYRTRFPGKLIKNISDTSEQGFKDFKQQHSRKFPDNTDDYFWLSFYLSSITGAPIGSNITASMLGMVLSPISLPDASYVPEPGIFSQPTQGGEYHASIDKGNYS